MVATKFVGVTVILLLACNALPGWAALTDEEKSEILNAHNRYRRRVNPIATNMAKLVSLIPRAGKCTGSLRWRNHSGTHPSIG